MAQRIFQVVFGLIGGGIGLSIGFLVRSLEITRSFVPTAGYPWYLLLAAITLVFALATFLSLPG